MADAETRKENEEALRGMTKEQEDFMKDQFGLSRADMTELDPTSSP